MKKRTLISTVSTLLSLLLSTASFAAAATEYTETALTIPKERHCAIQLTDFKAGPNGYLNYFVIDSMTAMTAAPTQFQSRDYGNTWKQIDMSWYRQILDLNPGYGEASNFFVARNGDIYCLAREKMVQREMSKNSFIQYDVYGAYKYAGGKAEKIPNISVGSPDGPLYSIVNVDDKGEITIQHISFADGSTDDAIGVTIYDANGKLLKKTPMPSKGWSPKKFVNNRVYGIDYNTNASAAAIAFDTQTGKQVVSVPLPNEKRNVLPKIAVANDGTIYITTLNELYQCAPGASAFTKVSIAAPNNLSKDTVYVIDAVCADDGTVYLPTVYVNLSNANDAKNDTQGKLYRYSPK